MPGKVIIINSSSNSIQAINITMDIKVHTKEETTKERKGITATLTRIGMTRVLLIIPTTKEGKEIQDPSLANEEAMEITALTLSMGTKIPTVGSKANGTTVADAIKAMEGRTPIITAETTITTTLKPIRLSTQLPIIRRNLHLLLQTAISRLRCWGRL